jgi:general secretion pathway protein D
MAGSLECSAQPAPVLTRLEWRSSSESAGEIRLGFANLVPSYRLEVGTNNEYRLVLPNTSRALTAYPLVPTVACISRGELVAEGGSLKLFIQGSESCKITVQRNDSSNLIVAIRKAAPTRGADRPVAAALETNQTATGHAVILLKYAEAAEIATILVPGAQVALDAVAPPPAFMANQESVTSLAGPFGNQYQQAPPATPSQGVSGQGAQMVGPHVAIDRRLNAVVLAGTADYIDDARKLIQTLDVPTPSVVLEAALVELTESASHALGLDASPNGTIVTVTSTAATQNRLASTASFQAALYAQISTGNGRILAQPRVATMSGVAASILTGDSIPVFTTIAYPGGGTITQTQLQYVNVGVSLQIQPRVSSDGTVISRVFSEVSSVTAFFQGAPQIARRQATTVATAHDGEPFVIGGLLQETEIRSISKIPLLGDLPVIGSLFRLSRYSKQRANLYIVITPHVVHATPDS